MANLYVTSSSVLIRRATLTDYAELLALLSEYFDEQKIQYRDTAESLQQELAATALGFYLALDTNDALLGCIFGHPLPSMGADAAECKRLFVRPRARGQGTANQLLSHLETKAAEHGFRWLYLDSLESFTTALRLYTRRHYEPCGRYLTSDPQATHFFRKALIL